MKLLPYTLTKKEALDKLRDQSITRESEIQSATTFVKEIEKGNLDVQYANEGESKTINALGESLISMRDQMKKFSQAEKDRNWSTEGLAKFADILRAQNDDLKSLSDNIISNLVRYMKANQGALFLINEDNPNDRFIEMTGCYAYGRRKQQQQRIEIGNGLIGQVVLEKDVLYMTDIPNDFIKITSGLGEALPRNLLMVPLKLDDKVYGVVEIASFDKIKPYQIDFAKKLSESIASTIHAVKVSESTTRLLHETQAQAEQMRSQEEEMRQNMEELSATQEEMQRILQAVQKNEKDITELINVSSDSILTIDKDFKVSRFNSVFLSTFTNRGLTVGKGFDILNIFGEAEREIKRRLYTRVFNGEVIQNQDHLNTNGFDNYFHVSHAPIRDTEGNITSIAVFAKDITEIVNAKNSAEKLAQESQQRSEELKAQEEELRQNMEELSATQDEMQRILSKVQEKETYLNNLVNAYNDAIMTVDLDCKVVLFNEYIAKTFAAQGLVLEVGMDALLLAKEETRQHSTENYKRAFHGETVVEQQEFFGRHYEISTVPLKDTNGKIAGATVFTKDITSAVVMLNESQQKTEEMKAQEEELRQNMEELSATQDEMQRVLQEVQAKEGYLNEVINAAKDSIFTLDRDGKVISSNHAFNRGLEALGVQVEKGFDMLSIFSHDEKELDKQRSYYARAFNGEPFEVTDHSVFNGVESYYNVRYSPLKREKGEVFAIAVFAKDVTETMKTKHVTENFLQESKNLQAYYNDVIDGLGDSVLTVDRDFKIVIANTTFKKVFSQYGVSTAPGENLLEMAKNGNVEEFKKPYLKALTGETVEIPHRHHFDRDFHVYYNPLKNNAGEVIGVSLIAHDITERLAMQKKTEELLTQAQAGRHDIGYQKRITDEFKAKELEYERRIAALERKLSGKTDKVVAG